MKWTWCAAVPVAGGVLAGCGAKEKEQVKATDLHVRLVGLALKQYEFDTGSFPTTDQGLKALVAEPDGLSEGAWKGPYLDDGTVRPDAWQQPLNYASPGKHGKDFDVWSNGPDGKSGTEDDVVSWD